MNETPPKQSASSDSPHGNSAQPEGFAPPSITSLASLTDGREAGDFRSRYPRSAWVQIALEMLYLLGILTGAGLVLIWMAVEFNSHSANTLLPSIFGDPIANSPLCVWTAGGLSGACGGAAASLKWLYHSVAKQQWHRDRVVWRIVVPPLSGTLSVFTGLMIVSGLIPILSKTPFDNPASGAAFGFFVGFFSDNLLASLQKLAHKVFGTIDKDRF